MTPLSKGEDGRLATTLAGSRILFNSVAAPLLYVSATESSAIVPYAAAEKSTVAVEAEYLGSRSEPLTLPVTPSHPGIFTHDVAGLGRGAILNEDGTVNSVGNPAHGVRRSDYVTGEG